MVGGARSDGRLSDEGLRNRSCFGVEMQATRVLFLSAKLAATRVRRALCLHSLPTMCTAKERLRMDAYGPWNRGCPSWSRYVGQEQGEGAEEAQRRLHRQCQEHEHNGATIVLSDVVVVVVRW